MKIYLVLIVAIATMFGFSCKKNEYIKVLENDTIRYVAFEPHVVVLKDHPYALEMDGLPDEELYFKVDRWDKEFKDSLYSNFSCKVSSLQDNIMLTWGAQGSSFKYYVEKGSKISSNQFMFEFGLTMAGRELGLSHSVWNLNEQPTEGYIGVKSESGEDVYYGWVNLSVTDTSMTVKECAMSKIANQPIVVGAIP
jgi:hypothetical protein